MREFTRKKEPLMSNEGHPRPLVRLIQEAVFLDPSSVHLFENVFLVTSDMELVSWAMQNLE